MMRTVEILKKTALYGAVVSVIGAAFCHHRIQAHIASMDYYKMSVAEFQKHEQAVEFIGRPVGFRYVNLSRKDIALDPYAAQIVIPVRGSKTTGNLYGYATRQDLTKGWILRRLELEVNQSTNRLTIIDNSEGHSPLASSDGPLYGNKEVWS